VHPSNKIGRMCYISPFYCFFVHIHCGPVCLIPPFPLSVRVPDILSGPPIGSDQSAALCAFGFCCFFFPQSPLNVSQSPPKTSPARPLGRARLLAVEHPHPPVPDLHLSTQKFLQCPPYQFLPLARSPRPFTPNCWPFHPCGFFFRPPQPVTSEESSFPSCFVY